MYRGVFLFGDVSGFTPLSEKLKALGQIGAEKITEIINSLFSELVAILFDHGGVLLKFGGDALLGLFPAETDEAGLAYAQSYSLVRFMIDSYGSDLIYDLLQMFRNGSAVDNALMEVYGFDSEGLDNEWRESLGLPSGQMV